MKTRGLSILEKDIYFNSSTVDDYIILYFNMTMKTRGDKYLCTCPLLEKDSNFQSHK